MGPRRRGPDAPAAQAWCPQRPWRGARARRIRRPWPLLPTRRSRPPSAGGAGGRAGAEQAAAGCWRRSPAPGARPRPRACARALHARAEATRQRGGGAASFLLLPRGCGHASSLRAGPRCAPCCTPRRAPLPAAPPSSTRGHGAAEVLGDSPPRYEALLNGGSPT